MVGASPNTEPTAMKHFSLQHGHHLQKPQPWDRRSYAEDSQRPQTSRNSQLEKRLTQTTSHTGSGTCPTSPTSRRSRLVILRITEDECVCCFLQGWSQKKSLRQVCWGQGHKQLWHVNAPDKEGTKKFSGGGAAKSSALKLCLQKHSQFTLFHCQRNASAPGLLISVYSIPCTSPWGRKTEHRGEEKTEQGVGG